ncbi:GYF domain-containing protein [Chryseobacterium sp. 6424]|uniref:GYF domain-containing protein n=1 Tax=Chryseobacterium sp. 6424 TaxID=2039166 RepID=UPI0013CEB7C8|nr:GYF domain-containing protein [Chryseobacterium sp. 6424]
MDKKYWIKIQNSENGPFSFNDLLNYDINPETPFWFMGLEEWISFKHSNIFSDYNIEKERIKLLELEKIEKKRKTKRRIKRILFISIPFILIYLFFYCEYRKNDVVSNSLIENNLNGRVKIITSNDFSNASVQNVEFFDIKGNRKFYSNVSFSTSVKFGEKGISNLTIRNFLVVETTSDSLNTSYIKQKLAQISNFDYLTSKINLRDSNEEFKDIENIAETRNLEVWIKDNNGNRIEKRIYNEKGELQNYPESYCLNINQNKIFTVNCDKENNSFIGDTLSIEILNEKKEKIEETLYFSSDKSNRIKKLFKNNMLIKEETYDKDGEKWSFINYETDKFKNKISEDKFTDITKTKYKDLFDDYLGTNKESHKKYEYTYDNRNNWIEYSGFENDKELFRTNRKIEYYSFWEFLKNYFK